MEVWEKVEVREKVCPFENAPSKTLPISLVGAQFFGGFKAQLEAAGQGIPDADLWIASIARAVRAKIVTGNSRHLSRVPGVECEDWIRG